MSAIIQWRYGFHTLPGGIDTGGVRCRHPIVMALDVRKNP